MFIAVSRRKNIPVEKLSISFGGYFRSRQCVKVCKKKSKSHRENE